MKLERISQYLKNKVLEVCESSQTGHVGACLGAVELFTVLYFDEVLRYDPKNPCNTDRDLVAIRGHLGPLRYAIFNLLGWLDDSEMVQYRKFKSRLPGHEDHFITPGVDISPTGSLGMLLSYIAGAAYESRRLGRKQNFFAFIGDGEEQEGNISEAARHIAHCELSNVIAILDKNGKQLSDPTDFTDSAIDIEKIWQGYGWKTIVIDDGHSLVDISKAYKQALINEGSPTLIIANTSKGNGVPGNVEHFSGYHTYSTVPKGLIRECLASSSEILDSSDIKEWVREIKPIFFSPEKIQEFRPVSLRVAPDPETPDNPDMCQFDYFLKLGAVWNNADVLYFITADTTQADLVRGMKISDYTEYLNVGIREQHAIGFAYGIGIINPSARIVFNTLEAFVYRWLDQLNALIQGGGNIVIIADCAGLTNATNGKTHQASSQPCAIRAMAGVRFLEPSNSKETFACLNWAIGESRGVVYLRSARMTATVNRNHYSSGLLSNNCVYGNPCSKLCIVSSGAIVQFSIEAAERLESQHNMSIKVINIIDHNDIVSVVKSVAGSELVIVAYNGNPSVISGPLSEEILRCGKNSGLRLFSLGFTIGQTGTVNDLFQYYQLDADGIIKFIISIKN